MKNGDVYRYKNSGTKYVVIDQNILGFNSDISGRTMVLFKPLDLTNKQQFVCEWLLFTEDFEFMYNVWDGRDA